MAKVFFNGNGDLIDQCSVLDASAHLKDLKKGAVSVYNKMLQDENPQIRKIAETGLARMGSLNSFSIN